METPVTVTSPGEYHATFGPSLGADQPLGHGVGLFFANGGTSAIVVRAAGPAPEQLVPVDGASGLNALEDSGVTVLAIPGLTAAHHQHVTAALTFCAAHRSVLLLDLPAGVDTDLAQVDGVVHFGPGEFFVTIFGGGARWHGRAHATDRPPAARGGIRGRPSGCRHHVPQRPAPS